MKPEGSFCIHKSTPLSPTPKSCVAFCSMVSSYGENVLRPRSKSEDHTLSAVSNWLFSSYVLIYLSYV
jgi:hypothetical protein